MKRIIKKIIIVSVILILLLFQNCCTYTFAFSVGDLSGNTVEAGELEQAGNKLIQIISTIGSILSVIVIIVLGIKYMTGSIEEKASYKKSLLPFLIGAIFIFAASSVASIIYGIAINL